ncbi:unnamed protein product [marine sediment metagenome]|uniref:Uncharacterized protein n=1 Tax=marine sediment metagenome TaxID=412755 RepID=X1BEN8_9ZZZZ
MAWIGQVPFEDIGMTEDKMTLLAELAEDSSYWKKAHGFVRSIAGSVPSSLSYNQRQWLTTIILDLDNELDKRAWKL